MSDDPAQRDRLVLEALLDRVEAQDLTGAQELAPAATEAPPSELRSRALGLLDRERGHVGPARTWLRQALQLAIEAADVEAITRAALAAAVLHVRMGEGRAAVEVLEHATLTDDPELSTDVLTTRAIGLWQTHASAEAARLLGDVPIDPDGTPWEAELVATRGMFALFDGRPAESLVDLDTAIRFAHLWRPSTNQTRIHTLRSRARYMLGDWDGAAIDAAAARALAPGNAEAWSAAIAFGASVPVAANRGQFDVASHYLARAREALPDWAPEIITDQVRAQEVVLAQARADHRGVLAALEPARSHEQWGTSTRVGHELLRARIGALVALGRLGEAEADLHRYETVLDEVPHSPGPRRLHLVRGLLAEAGGRPGRARDHYAAELADPELRQNPFLLAQTLHTAGKLERPSVTATTRCAASRRRRTSTRFWRPRRSWSGAPPTWKTCDVVSPARAHDEADAPGAGRRRPRETWVHQQGGRRRAVPDRQDGRVPPAQHLRQARCHRPPAAPPPGRFLTWGGSGRSVGG